MTANIFNITRPRLSLIIKACSVFVVAAGVSGCTTGALDLFGSAQKVDRTLSTATVPNQNRSTESMSDEKTILNAVSSADLIKLGSSPLPWANTSTGSAGVVSDIREVSMNNQPCRAFLTTRHSYEGISRFRGNACLIGAEWNMLSFAPQKN
ncbi:RT0821/Lpp0805 family surface protein [Rhizobium helianthi]|uniref:RT0821/Lpp0805 family surface protein n=1 Tax=Rhizobium helianthi TaxID=1132695 RepID=A0ABW4M6J8_9HYPH